MPIGIGSAEMKGLSVGAREVQRAVLNGKTVYEPLREVALKGKQYKVWESIPTNSLCYPVGTGENRGVAFKYPVTCSKPVYEWRADGVAITLIKDGTVIPAGKAVWPSSGIPYVFTRVD